MRKKGILYILVIFIFCVAIAIFLIMTLTQRNNYNTFLENTQDSVVDVNQDADENEIIFINSFVGTLPELQQYGISGDDLLEYFIEKNYDRRVTLSWTIPDNVVYLYLEYDDNYSMVDYIVWSADDNDIVN